MTYKGYEGVVKFDEDAHIFHGEVISTRDVITFQGTTVDELEQAFRDSVDDYLAFCAKRGEEPEKPFSGNILVRTNPELHKEITLAARREGKSVNAYILDKLTTKKKRAAVAS